MIHHSDEYLDSHNAIFQPQTVMISISKLKHHQYRLVVPFQMGNFSDCNNAYIKNNVHGWDQHLFLLTLKRNSLISSNSRNQVVVYFKTMFNDFKRNFNDFRISKPNARCRAIMQREIWWYLVLTIKYWFIYSNSWRY